MHKTTVKNIQRTAKCANLTRLSVLVDDGRRFNINTVYSIITCNRHRGLAVGVLVKASGVY